MVIKKLTAQIESGFMLKVILEAIQANQDGGGALEVSGQHTCITQPQTGNQC